MAYEIWSNWVDGFNPNSCTKYPFVANSVIESELAMMTIKIAASKSKIKYQSLAIACSLER